MTTFARKTFDVAGYLACRPTYPAKVYEVIQAYHASTGRFDRALDLGCGPGFIALNLASRFKHVLALDPSEKMIRSGLQPEPGANVVKIDYKVGNAEEITKYTGQGEEGLDLVVAGQAAHWFDYPKVWRELTEAVRPGGTVAFIGYAEMVFPRYPQLNTLISQLSRNDDQLGPYWQPGRRIVEGLLDAVPFPTKPAPPPSVTLAGHQFVTARVAEPALQHVAGPIDAETWRPESAIRLKEIDGAPWLMTKRFDISALEGYLRTWSSLHAFHELHPEDAARKGRGGEDGDIVDRAMGRIRRGLADAGHQDKQIEVGWPLILMMIQKRL